MMMNMINENNNNKKNYIKKLYIHTGYYNKKNDEKSV
jgi:hypothetical protein